MADTEDLIYLDYNATTPLHPRVTEKVYDALTTFWANPSSSYDLGKLAKSEVEKSRKYISVMINANNENEITFTSGGTESNNHVLHNAIRYYTDFTNGNPQLKPHIISTVIEHDSILQCLEDSSKYGLVEYTLVPVDVDRMTITPNSIMANVKDNTVLISVMHANNELGLVQPIEEISSELISINQSWKKLGLPKIYLHTDAAQTIGKIPVDIQKLGMDYLTIVGHKFYGPRIGALYHRMDTPFSPFLTGGGQERGNRAGTENTPMIIGLGEAAAIVSEQLEDDIKHMTKLRNDFENEIIKGLHERDWVINGKNYKRLPNTSSISFIGKRIKRYSNTKDVQKCAGKCRGSMPF